MIVSSALLSLFLHNVTLPKAQELPSISSAIYEQQGSLSVVTGNASLVSSVAAGSQHIPMLSLTMTASCNADIPITAINIVRRGLGANSDIQSVYAESGNSRLSSARSISKRDGIVQLRLRRFTVPSCETRTVGIFVDFSADASIAGEHSISLAPIQPIDAGNARVSLQIADAPIVRRTTGSVRSSVTVDMLDINQRISYGNRRTVARYRLTEEGNEQQQIQSIRFTNLGSASDNHLRNLYLQTSAGKRVSSILSQMEGDTAFITFDQPLIIASGRRLVFELKADIRASRSKTIQFTIEEPSDVRAIRVRNREQISQ